MLDRASQLPLTEDEALAAALSQCRAALQNTRHDLQHLFDGITGTRRGTRLLAATKTAVRRKDIDGLAWKLEQAKSSLLLAVQISLKYVTWFVMIRTFKAHCWVL